MNNEIRMARAYGQLTWTCCATCTLFLSFFVWAGIVNGSIATVLAALAFALFMFVFFWSMTGASVKLEEHALVVANWPVIWLPTRIDRTKITSFVVSKYYGWPRARIEAVWEHGATTVLHATSGYFRTNAETEAQLQMLNQWLHGGTSAH